MSFVAPNGRRWLRLLATVALALAVRPPDSAAISRGGNQTLTSGTFVLMQGRDTAAVETFHRGQLSVDGELAFRLGGIRTRYAMKTRPDGSVMNFEQSVWHLGDAPGAAPFTRAVVSFEGDSAFSRVVPGGMERRRAASDVVVFINPSVVMMEQIVRHWLSLRDEHAKVSAFLANGMTLPVVVRRISADSLTLDLGGADVRLAVDSAGAVRGGAVPSQKLRITRSIYSQRGLDVARPDYSAPHDAPYAAENVQVPTPEGFHLAGTLTRPRNASGRLPAVVMITGSGPEDRDESLPGLPGYRPFRQIADALARRGIATLRLDDRGIGESAGHFATATTLDFAKDTRAALAWLRARPGIDPTRLALVGHSEGALIAPMVAQNDVRLRAIVLMAGPSRTGRRIIEYQNREAVDRKPREPAERDSLLRVASRQIDSLATVQPWMKFFLSYDPIPAARRVRIPVLILQGATDHQVTPDQAPELEAAFRAGGNRDVTMKRFENLDHLFLEDPSGDPINYGSLPSRQVRADVLESLSSWLEQRLKQAEPRGR